MSVWPERRSSAAGVRVWQWIDRFQARGWRVALHSAAHRQGAAREVIEELDARGIERFEGDVNSVSWTRALRRWNPDWVWMDRFVVEEQWSWRALLSVPEAMRILDTQDLHFLRAERSLPFLDADDSARLGAELHERKCREIGAILRSDVSLVLSTAEMNVLTRTYGVPSEKIAWSPYAYASPPEPRTRALRRHFVFLGNYRHAPNLDAVLWFATTHWPALRRRLPQSEWHLYGAYLPSEVKALERIEGVRVRGQARDACATLAKYVALLAPLRFGAGIKGKVVDAWWAGTPVLTSAIGSEGLMPVALNGIKDGIGDGVQTSAWEIPLKASDGWVEMAAAIEESEEFWAEVQQSGRQVLVRWHSQAEADRLLESLCAKHVKLKSLRRHDLHGESMLESSRLWMPGFSAHIAIRRQRAAIASRLAALKNAAAGSQGRRS